MSTFYQMQEGPVNALALNKENTQVAIGGRNVFKVYAIEEDRFREICNVRGSKHLNVGFSYNDVSWCPTDDHYLATAATNGHVAVWNLTKTGKAMQEQDYQDHRRTVNKVNFHASEPYRLISGSQDGTMRYFDVRLKSAVTIFESNTESVRDVQFSPHNPYTFSAVSDNGSVQLWDIRKPEKCQMQYTAHSGPVFACDWHPELLWLATASRDRTIKVWDLTNKPTIEYTIHTIGSVGHVKWRPQRKYHIASCALVIDCTINVWDIRRPYIPFAAFCEHRGFPSCVEWKGDPDIFLSGGRDSTIYQHAFHDASRPAEKAIPQGLALNNNCEVMFAKKVPQFQTVTTNSTPSSLAKSAVGLMRKISTTQSIEQFHIVSSMVQHIKNVPEISNDESQNMISLAKNYVLHGRSISELCEHNSAVARQFGKPHISVVWKIIKTMYGEEFMQNSINSSNSSREEVQHTNISMNNIGNSVIQIENSLNNIRDMETEPKTASDTQPAQFSGGDDETENEDQVDHIAISNNGFPTYLNYRSGLPKGDFSFGENELDMELDSLNSDFHSGYRGFNHGTSDGSDWILPNEAFPIRHEIQDRSPPPEQFPNHHSPDIQEDPQAFQIEETSPPLICVSKAPKKSSWDPSSLVVETLYHHADFGDIQTTACVLIVLGDCRKFLSQLDEATQEHWLLGYIEILSSFKLWNIVTQIIKLSWLPSIYQLNQQSTRINTNCGNCSKSLQRVGWLCDRCHSSECALCSICNQVVKGLYVWCQGCSHGGHMAHIKQWALSNKKCPAGCGHMCEYG